MQPENKQVLRELLTRQRVLTLAVLVRGRPYAGLLPFALRPDAEALVIHASRLARHSEGLGDGLPFAALVQAPDRPESDPLQLPRVSLQGEVRALPPGHPEHAGARAAYLAKFPGSARTFALDDFRLYQLVVRSGRLIAGFGRISNLGPGALRLLSPSGSSGPAPA